MTWILAKIGGLLVLPALLAPLPGQGLDAFFERSGQVVRETAPETRLYWRSHLDTSRQRIIEAAQLSGATKVATVLGSGIGMEIPLAELARRFDRLVLVDLDGHSMLYSLQEIPREFRAKVDLKVMDVTTFASRVAEQIERAVEASSSAAEAFERFETILDGLRIGDAVPLPKSDFVVSSLLLSEIPRYPFSYAAQAVETRFGVALQTWGRSDEFFRRLVHLAIEDHVLLLVSLVESHGVIYFSDTVAKGLVRRPQGQEIRRVVEGAAVDDSTRLGLGDSAAEVASVASRLCRGRYSPSAEAEAFERILAAFHEPDGQFFEALLPVADLRDQCRRLGLELRGSPASWWWLAYPCKILGESGAFLVNNWVLGIRN